MYQYTETKTGLAVCVFRANCQPTEWLKSSEAATPSGVNWFTDPIAVTPQISINQRICIRLWASG